MINSVILFVCLTFVGCIQERAPSSSRCRSIEGKWQGMYSGQGLTVDIRVNIVDSNAIEVSYPDRSYTKRYAIVGYREQHPVIVVDNRVCVLAVDDQCLLKIRPVDSSQRESIDVLLLARFVRIE